MAYQTSGLRNPIVKRIHAESAAKKLKEQQAAAQAQEDAYGAERKTGRDVLQGIAGHEVPGVTAAAVDPAFRNAQVQLLQQLTQRSQGQGPSLAQQQFQQAGNTALQKSMGAIRAATGTNAALGGRTAALASTNLLGNIAAESGMARLREQQDAQKMLGDLAGAGRLGDLQGRQQDINMGLSNAEIALKNAAVRQGAAEGLLGNTTTKYEGALNRAAQIEAAKAGAKGGGGGGIMEQLLPAVVGGAATIIAAKYAPATAPAAGAAASAATKKAMGPNLVGDQPTATDAPTTKSARGTANPFMRIRR